MENKKKLSKVKFKLCLLNINFKDNPSKIRVVILRTFSFTFPVADLHSKILDVRPPRVQILSISCSLWEILAKSYVGAPWSWRPLLGEILDPPLISVKNLFFSLKIKSPFLSQDIFTNLWNYHLSWKRRTPNDCRYSGGFRVFA